MTVNSKSSQRQIPLEPVPNVCLGEVFALYRVKKRLASSRDQSCINNSRHDDISHHSLGMLGFCHFFFRKLQMPHVGGSSFIQKPHCRALKKIEIITRKITNHKSMQWIKSLADNNHAYTMCKESKFYSLPFITRMSWPKSLFNLLKEFTGELLHNGPLGDKRKWRL